MSRLSSHPAPTWTQARLRRHLGMIPSERIVFEPPPGKATVKDVLRRNNMVGALPCELVDGVLVEKPMGARESLLAAIIAQYLNNYLDTHNLGIVLGSDGPVRLLKGLVRLPDVSFISWDRLPEDELPDVPELAPDLAVEVISKGNTKEEMKRKLEDYFGHGTKLAWYVYPKTRSVRVYTSAEEFIVLRERQALDGGDLLPGFKLPLSKLFSARRRPKGR